MSERPNDKDEWWLPHVKNPGDCRFLQRRNATRARLFFSVVLIAAGVLLFLSNLGILPIRNIWVFWPVLPIMAGVGSFTHARNASARVWGVFLVVFGGFFLLLNLGWLNIRTHDGSWPLSLMLIAAGFAALLSVLESSRKTSSSPTAVPGAELRSYQNAVNDFILFGNLKRKLESLSFQGGDLTTIFGSIEIDLRRSLIALPATSATVNVTAVFGAIKIRASENWRVHVSGAAILGNFEDKTIPPNIGLDAPTLVITGLSIFGSVEIED